MGLGMITEGGLYAVKNHKNSFLILYNWFLFCNSFLLFVRYLHGGQEDTVRLDIKNMLLDKKTCAE